MILCGILIVLLFVFIWSLCRAAKIGDRHYGDE
jgi:hypothetical protein